MDSGMTAMGYGCEEYLVSSHQAVLRELALLEGSEMTKDQLFGECDKLVFDDICFELVYTILDFLDKAPAEEERAAELRQLFAACQL